MNNKKFCIVDIETTGLSACRHSITEIAAVIFDGNKIIKQFCTLVNPECHIPSYITGFTGITNEMVADAPNINNALPKFTQFLEDNIFVAHNATFDKGFLTYNANNLNIDFEPNVLCTRKLATRLLPDLPSKSLANLCEHFAVKNKSAHRALGDVMATVQIFGNFLEMLDQIGIKNNTEIFQFQKTSPKQIFLNYKR